MDEKHQFFINNKTAIGKMIERENIRRSLDKEQLLTEEDIDFAIGEMMVLDDFSKYTFHTGTPNTVDLERQRRRKIDKSEDVRHQARESVVGSVKSSFRFDIVSCENGHVLNIPNGKTFIFRNKIELMRIFNKLFFKKEHIQELPTTAPDTTKTDSKKEQVLVLAGAETESVKRTKKERRKKKLAELTI